MLLFETPANPKEIIQWHSAQTQKSYQNWVAKLKSSRLKGVQRLINKLEKQPENFLDFLVEFNIARQLFRSRKIFEHETAGEDFAFDNYLISVKSIHESKEKLAENKKISELMPQVLVRMELLKILLFIIRLPTPQYLLLSIWK